MVSTSNGESTREGFEESESSVNHSSSKLKGLIPLQISASEKELLPHENPQKGFLDSIKALPRRMQILKFDPSRHSLASPSAKFRQIAEGKDEISRSVPSSTSQGLRHFNMSFPDINWDSLWKMSKDWIKSPINMALLVWIICVAVSGAILFMVMIGMLNHALPKKSQRNAWFEVNNQILNGLFTLMCLYQHPKRIHHLVLLCRWRPEDVSRLRKIYCKNGTYKPHEWAHMMVVVVLLNLNCFGQYALCILNVAYNRSNRPAIGVAICISVAIGGAAIAGLYTIISPLGKDYEPEMDHEAQNQISSVDVNSPINLRLKSLEKRFSFALRDGQSILENRPKWKGGLFDFWDDISVAYLSLFCSFCVFGWNMERLGFGNMYVHIATFILFCMAPFWIFNLAAINIDNEAVREALGVTGIVLCVFGLLYGGFWRIQMRKRFNLPANTFCCGSPAVTDCAQWLCCCWCSLSQEVRTGDFYDIVENKFYRKQTNGSDQTVLSPLPREDGLVPLRFSESSSVPRRFSRGSDGPDGHLPIVVEESSIGGPNDGIMTPPVPSLIQREDSQISV